MLDASSHGVPTTPDPRQPFQRSHTLPAGGVAALTVVAIAAVVWAAEIRMARQLARSEADLAERLARTEQRLKAGKSRREYWQIYSDVMADLGGMDGGLTDSGRP